MQIGDKQKRNTKNKNKKQFLENKLLFVPWRNQKGGGWGDG